MKKIILFSVISMVFTASVYAAVPWWTRPTICRLNPSDCYKPMGAGFDSGMWDAVGNCWGMKLICPDALSGANDGVPVPMGRAEIASGRGINPDFDTSLLRGDCFGRRKTTSNGTQVSVDGKYVNVWCSGVLSMPDGVVDGGEFALSQPTCAELAADGYVGVLNKTCYGKYYDPEKYYIECGDTGIMPTRMIVLNGASNTTDPGKVPVTAADADKIFNEMQSVSRQQYEKYFLTSE